tara:strand:- start:112 stop:624 length:513 start_codon:yes stop_codon:yes gene_type:complete
MFFRYKYAFLSNFYIAPFIDADLRKWPTSEHYYQAMKTLDYNARKQIREHPLKGLKRFARSFPLRDNWDAPKEFKLKVMHDALEMKFNQNPDIAKLLINTGSEHLIEDNYWHDNYWGNCLCNKCKDIDGLNVLGQQLMKRRFRLCRDQRIKRKRSARTICEHIEQRNKQD